MTERTQEQLDLVYAPLQQELRSRFEEYHSYANIVYDGNGMDYLEWLEFNLNEINEEIANLKEQQ